MHRATLLGLFAVLSATASLTACGGDTTGSTSTGAGGGSGGSTTTSTTSTTATTTATSSASGTGGSGPTLINGCDLAKLEDHTMDATVEIKFGDAIGLLYSPPCIKVKSGTKVTFTGNLDIHPLAGGEVIVGMAASPDPASPIKNTITGATVSFTIASAGSYPYFCTEHYSAGMKGLVVAE
jgi:plastocyanin